MKDFKLVLGNYLARFPMLFSFFVRQFGHKKKGRQLISSSTKIVFEGFPRTANTFALQAFLLSQQGRVTKEQVAHHIHKVSQILLAIEYKIPVVLLIRDPASAVLSAKVRQPQYSIKALLQAYIYFHQPLINKRDAIVVAEFNEITKDFNTIIDRINDKFHLSYSPFIASPENIQQIQQNIANLEDVTADPQNAAERVSIPTAIKDQKKKAMQAELDNHPLLLEQANALYNELIVGF